MKDCGTEAAREAVEAGLEMFVAKFGQWVKSLASRPETLRTPAALSELEEEVALMSKQIECQLIRTLVQSSVDQHQEGQRICPKCQQRRRHKGVRPHRVVFGSGEARVSGIYWQCPACGIGGHSAEGLLPGNLSLRMEQMVCLLGVSLASFDKAELVARKLLLVRLDDGLIRRTCMQAGWELQRQEHGGAVPVEEGQVLVGSCDGTMVHTREDGWREIKGFRFEHAGGRCGGAYLETAEQFTPRLKDDAEFDLNMPCGPVQGYGHPCCTPSHAVMEHVSMRR